MLRDKQQSGESKKNPISFFENARGLRRQQEMKNVKDEAIIDSAKPALKEGLMAIASGKTPKEALQQGLKAGISSYDEKMSAIDDGSEIKRELIVIKKEVNKLEEINKVEKELYDSLLRIKTLKKENTELAEKIQKLRSDLGIFYPKFVLDKELEEKSKYSSLVMK